MPVSAKQAPAHHEQDNDDDGSVEDQRDDTDAERVVRPHDPRRAPEPGKVDEHHHGSGKPHGGEDEADDGQGRVDRLARVAREEVEEDGEDEEGYALGSEQGGAPLVEGDVGARRAPREREVDGTRSEAREYDTRDQETVEVEEV
jgi:hypothetical protein